MPNPTIRPADASDVPLILSLIRELALFEQMPDAVHATESSLLEFGFGPQPRFGCLLAESDGSPAGLALYFHNFSTWTGKPGIHLEDLFVREAFRGQGIGKALLTSVARLAEEAGYPRLQWEVLQWNTPALEFYRARGAKPMSEWVTMRVDDEALRKLAAEAPGGMNRPHGKEVCRGTKRDARAFVQRGSRPVRPEDEDL